MIILALERERGGVNYSLPSFYTENWIVGSNYESDSRSKHYTNHFKVS